MDMSEEVLKAKERIKTRIDDSEDYQTIQVWLTEDIRCAKVLLKYIQELEELLEIKKELK